MNEFKALISIRGKSWLWVARHFTVLAFKACQIIRFVSVDQGTEDFFTRFESDPKVTIEVYTSHHHTEVSLTR